jgi:tetrapyrrole methylase family protein/MazG family protein
MALKKKVTLPQLVRLMARLRAPGGCPWDRAQTHESLLKYLREETREVEEAIEKKDWENLQEELGDILLQILFHSELAQERGDFSIGDVLATLQAKLVRRHPHVFAPKKNDPPLTPEEVKRRWVEIKEREKAMKKGRSRP